MAYLHGRGLYRDAYDDRRGQSMYRKAYEEHFPPMDGREVTVHRVVNIVGRRNPMSREYDGDFDADNWYDGPRNFQDTREYPIEDDYPPNDRQYYDNPHFHRKPSPPRNEDPYSHQSYSAHDLRQYLTSRNHGRSAPHFHQRGRGSGPPVGFVPEKKAKLMRSHYGNHGEHKVSTSSSVKRGRSPGSREPQPPVRSGSSTGNRSLSPDGGKGHAPQQAQKKHKPSVPMSQTPSNSVESSSHSSVSSKEKSPASAVETEEVAAASMEPKLTPDEDFKARRLEAIQAKAQEIEKHYRQDCETFRMVVKMLVTKEPSLDGLLQAPLDKNLLEIKERCLDDLKHFVQELDEMIAGRGDEPEHDSPNTSTIFVQLEDDFPQLCSTNLTDTDGNHDVRGQPGHTEDSDLAPPENQGDATGKQTEDMEDSTRVSEHQRPGREEKPEQDCSEPVVLPSKGLPASAQGLLKRLQLYGCEGEQLSNGQLSNPRVWERIAHVKLGWVPKHPPFLQPGKYYRELKANSQVMASRNAAYLKGGKGKSRRRNNLPCKVICYIHAEGLWCEVLSRNGNMICVLTAIRPNARFPRKEN